MTDDLLTDVVDWIQGKRFGKYRGVVTDNADATKRGRLKVRVAALGDIEKWALPCVPYAGDGVGLLALPAAGTLVWVEFEMGDPVHGQMIWTGCFWGDGQAPEDGNPDIKTWKTTAHQLKLDDAGGEIVITNNNDVVVTANADFTVESAGQAKLTVGPSAGVVAEQGAAHKVEVTVASVRVNNGALELP